MKRKAMIAFGAALAAGLACLAPAGAQQGPAHMERVPDRQQGEGAGPFRRLVIRGATLIDGTGAPPRGPVDIVVAGNRIESIRSAGTPGLPLAQSREPRGADHEIDATGMYVLPGFVDVHGHNGDPDKAPNASYGYRLWLAHGVTTVRGVSLYFGDEAMSRSDRQRSAANTIVAPRLYDYAALGDWTQGDITSPERARAFVQWAAQRGFDGIKFFNDVPGPVTEAAIQEARRLHLGTVAHLGQGGVGEVNADRATEMGLQGVTHFYGHFESLLRDRRLPAYPN